MGDRLRSVIGSKRCVRIGVILTCGLLAGALMVPAQAAAEEGAATPSLDPMVTAVTPPADVTAPAAQPAEAPAAPEVPAATVEQVSVASVPKAVGPRGRLVVGDSLMVSVTPWMRSQGFRVHAKVGRQFSTAPGIARSFGSTLPRNLVIELGTNGTVSPRTCRSAVGTAGKYRRVFLVTPRVPRSWEAGNLTTLRACDASFSARRVRIIDWHAHSAGHPEWFAADRVHLSSAGRSAFSRLIDRAVDKHGLR
ncbi:MAG TPA: hypothetical protein VES03_07160 [Motilibacterales bacterium]|nr:hypothetical protein [Motilibacterales bacterium]